jgi:hypothetical protein
MTVWTIYRTQTVAELNGPYVEHFIEYVKPWLAEVLTINRLVHILSPVGAKRGEYHSLPMFHKRSWGTALVYDTEAEAMLAYREKLSQEVQQVELQLQSLKARLEIVAGEAEEIRCEVTSGLTTHELMAKVGLSSTEAYTRLMTYQGLTINGCSTLSRPYNHIADGTLIEIPYNREPVRRYRVLTQPD